jgi:hypothetical protein
MPVPDIASAKRTLKQGQHVLAFLVAKQGHYEFAEVWRTSYQVSAAAIHDAKTTKMDLESFLAKCLDDADPATVCEAIGVLSQLKSEKLKSRANLLARSNEPSIRGTAIVSGLKAGNGSYLRMALDYIENVEENSQEVGDAKMEMVSYIGTLNERTCLPTLHRLLSDPDMSVLHTRSRCGSDYGVGLRRNAMAAIHKIASEESVPYLMATMNNQDEQIRFDAVMALNKILGHPDDGNGLVRSSRQDYSALVNFWKAWWQTEDAAKYKTAPPAQ